MDRGKEAAEAEANNVTDVYGELADDITEVNKDSGDNDTRKNPLNTIVANTETSELGIDDDNEEDDENDIGEIADIFPDKVDS